MSASISSRTMDRLTVDCTLTAAVVSLRGLPRFFLWADVLDFLVFPRRFPVTPNDALILSTTVLLFVPLNPAACHASFTAWTLPWGWSIRNSLTNMDLPGLLAVLDILVAD